MGSVERITECLEKPEIDDRLYRVIRLPNKLEALLVHDPDTDKASAAMNVNVGSFSDPDDMPGMAHAVEHLLFMGTGKYPKENAYNQHLATHSGFSNAYTTGTETNYFFEVSAKSDRTDYPNGQPTPNGSVNGTAATLESGSAETSTSGSPAPFYGALDRFAQFFKAPLFLESTLDRELRAVDSENNKNRQIDLWRLTQLEKSLSNPAHPYHHFPTGNLQTLKKEPMKRGLDVRSEFIKFYEKHYSSNRMKLVLLGRESLDEMEQWVTELFSGVKDKDLPQNRWDDMQPWSADDMCKQIFAKPVMDFSFMEIYFSFLDEEHLYEFKPSLYISHLIRHEGPGSILAHIKAKGWADGLSSFVMPVCPGSTIFKVLVQLTQEGLRQYREVAKVVFEYIAMIKERDPEQWIFDEIKNLAEVRFRFQQKSPANSFTSHLSSVMQKPLPRERLLSGSLLRAYNPDLIKEALSHFRLDNFRMMIVSQDYPGNWNFKEKWYGTEYRVESIPLDFMADIQKALETTPKTRLPDLHMPHKNGFVPMKLSVEKNESPEPQKVPKLIRHDDHVRLWFKKDDQFWVPKATVCVTLRNPLTWATPANVVKSWFFCELVRDALGEYSFDAELAGLSYDLSVSIVGLNVSVRGYNEKMSVLLEKVLTSMRDLTFNQDQFHIVKERLTLDYKNAEYGLPFSQVDKCIRYITAERDWLDEQYAAELLHIEPEDISCFFPQLLRQNHIEVLVHGNLNHGDAVCMTNSVERILMSRPLPQSQWHVRRNIIIPPGSNFIYERSLKDPANVNHCIEYYLFLGNRVDDKLRSKLLLFAQITKEPVFDQLRSKEQLGYVVSSGARYSATTMGYKVVIQSEHTAVYLESRIDAFLSSFRSRLEQMTEEEFEGHKRSVINKRLEKLKNLDSETSRFWIGISSEYFEFLQCESDAANVRLSSKADLIGFYNRYIDPASPARGKLSVHLNAQSGAHVALMNTKERKTRLVSCLGKVLETAGFAVDGDRLSAALEKLDISTGGESKILDAFGNFLESEMSLSEQQTDSILEKAEQSLGLQLGLEESKSKPTVKGVEVYITNVPDFKARLAVSAGPSPIAMLSEFEELDDKL